MQLTLKGQVERGSGFTLTLNETLELAGVTAVVGGSGAGKSTLLRVIAGLEEVPDLKITVDNECWQDHGYFLKPHERAVGTVFQEPRLFPHLTIEENLKFGSLHSTSEGYAMSLPEVIEALDLEPLMNSHPNRLSGGQAQRVALARTLLRPAKFWMFDEPLSALDQRARNEIAPYLQRLCLSHEIPILYVTHALSEVLQIADRMLVIEAGQITASGGVDELASLYGSELPLIEDVGGVLSCEFHTYHEDYGLSELKLEQNSLFVRGNLSQQPMPIRLFVPARDVSIATRPISGASLLNRLPGVIEGLDYQEEDTCLVRLHCHGQILLSRITAYSAHQLDLTPGKSVQALIKTIALTYSGSTPGQSQVTTNNGDN